jgi:hypothetical protein
MTDRNTTITVADHDSLPSVLNRVTANGGSIRLVIPLGSSLFFTANEFQALRSVAEQRGASLTVATDDPLRQHLASMFDLAFVGETEGLEEEPSPELEPNESESPDQTPEPEPPKRPSWTGATAPIVAASNLVTDTNPEPDPAETEASTSDESIETAPPARLKPDRRRLYAGLAAAAVALILIGVAAAFFLVPRATVAVHLKEQPLNASIVYGVSTEGASPQVGSEVTVTGETVEADVTVESTTAATGEKSVPDKAASGMVVLSNPTSKEVTLEKGTRLVGDAGAVFLLDETVKIPAPTAVLGSPGLVEVKVNSEQPGTVGNLEQGDLSGKHESGVYFSNRNGAMTGGTDRMVQIVSEADLEKLRDDAEAKLRQTETDVLIEALPSGYNIVASSVAAGATNFTFDHKEGEEAENVSVTARTHVTALNYDEANLITQLTAALTPKFEAATPSGYELAPASIEVGEPALFKELPHGAQYSATATAKAVASFSDDAQDDLAGQLARKSNSTAETVLSGVPAIESFEVTYSPALLPDRMPGNTDRIEFEIDNAP